MEFLLYISFKTFLRAQFQGSTPMESNLGLYGKKPYLKTITFYYSELEEKNIYKTMDLKTYLFDINFNLVRLLVTEKKIVLTHRQTTRSYKCRHNKSVGQHSN